MIRRLMSVALCTCALAASAHAGNGNDNGSGWYLGVGGGKSETGVDSHKLAEKGVAYKGFAGYSFSDLWAVEVSYLNGGKVTEDLGAGVATDALAKGSNASILFRARTASAFALYGKLGYTLYDFDVTDRANGVVTGTENISDQAISYGLGVTYTFFTHMLIRVEYEGVNVKGGDLNALMLGLGYKF